MKEWIPENQCNMQSLRPFPFIFFLVLRLFSPLLVYSADRNPPPLSILIASFLLVPTICGPGHGSTGHRIHIILRIENFRLEPGIAGPTPLSFLKAGYPAVKTGYRNYASSNDQCNMAMTLRCRGCPLPLLFNGWLVAGCSGTGPDAHRFQRCDEMGKICKR